MQKARIQVNFCGGGHSVWVTGSDQ
jgi:hypothetical protein